MILELEHINKGFDGRQVLRDVCLGVDGGEVVGLLGGNGAGKTTLLRIATLLLQPDAGRVLFDGHPMTRADLRQVGYLPEERGLYRHAKAAEQAVFMARLKGLTAKEAREAVDLWFDRLGLGPWRDKPAGRLSKGMQQRLQFIVTVAHRPRLLILDEPFSGFDAEAAEMLGHELLTLGSQGTAILLSTHNPQAIGLCHRTIRL